MTHPALHIFIADSWHSDSAEGSGTAVGVRGLSTGLSRLGHDVELVRPRRGDRTLANRLAFNFDLIDRLGAMPSPDLVVGIDIDGFSWAGHRADADAPPPYVVCLKGIAADEARFEQGAARAALETLARFERLNARRADRVIVPSLYSAEVVGRLYGIAEDRIGVVPEPVDGSRWNDRSCSVGPPSSRSEGVVILSVARQYPRKDTATLLRAMAIVLDQRPDARLRIVGDGPAFPDSERLAWQLGIDGAVTFLGAVVSDDDVAREYEAADVFCLPSRQEGFGIAFVEAMAAGLPIVAVRAGAVPEVVPVGEAGTLVPPGDPEALARSLLTLLANPHLRHRMGQAGMERARRYDLVPVARAFLAEVAPLLGPATAPSGSAAGSTEER